MEPNQQMSLEEKTVEIEKQRTTLRTVGFLTIMWGILALIALFAPIEEEYEQIQFIIIFLLVIGFTVSFFAIKKAQRKLISLESDAWN